MTAPNEYEPSAEAVEALAKELHGVYLTERDAAPEWHSLTRVSKKGLLAEARFVLRRQHARESGLLLAVAQLATLGGGHSDGNRIAQAALAAHAKLDAPKVPTLLEAATAYVQSRHNTDDSNGKARAALIAAVEREERKG